VVIYQLSLMDDPMLTPSLMHHLSIVPDFRQAWKVQHQLSDILFLIVCAVICGAEGWDEIEDFGHAKLDFLRQYGDFEGWRAESRYLGQGDGPGECRAAANCIR